MTRPLPRCDHVPFAGPAALGRLLVTREGQAEPHVAGGAGAAAAAGPPVGSGSPPSWPRACAGSRSAWPGSSPRACSGSRSSASGLEPYTAAVTRGVDGPFELGTDGPTAILVGVDGSTTSLRAAWYV